MISLSSSHLLPMALQGIKGKPGAGYRAFGCASLSPQKRKADPKKEVGSDFFYLIVGYKF